MPASTSITMTTDRAAQLERMNKTQRSRRSRLRKVGLLPPLPTCPDCGCKVLTERWFPHCAVCAGGRGSWGVRNGHKARPLRLAAEEIIQQLREEARAGV